MYAVTIANDADEASVFAALLRHGRPRRPPWDIPRVFLLEQASADDVRKIDGVLACQEVDDPDPRSIACARSPSDSFAIVEPEDQLE